MENEIRTLPDIPQESAQEYMNSLLMDITDTDTIEEANTILVGRPRLGDVREPTTTINFKVPSSWKTLMTAEAKNRNQTLSDYIRELTAIGHATISAAEQA